MRLPSFLTAGRGIHWRARWNSRHKRLAGKGRCRCGGCLGSDTGEKLATRNLHRNVVLQAVLHQTAASAVVLFRLIVALLINGLAQKPTLRTKPNVT
jgi:hypothetical protein